MNVLFIHFLLVRNAQKVHLGIWHLNHNPSELPIFWGNSLLFIHYKVHLLSTVQFDFTLKLDLHFHSYILELFVRSVNSKWSLLFPSCKQHLNISWPRPRPLAAWNVLKMSTGSKLTWARAALVTWFIRGGKLPTTKCCRIFNVAVFGMYSHLEVRARWSTYLMTWLKLWRRQLRTSFKIIN